MLSGKLTKRFVQDVKPADKPQRFSDRNGLYLVVMPTGSKQWVARLRLTGRKNAKGNPLQIDMGLGGVSWVSLHEAREKAYEARAVARNGGDPRTTRKREILSFAELSQQVYQERLPTWKNPKHAKQWINTLETYAFPEIGAMTVDQIESPDVLRVLAPIWHEKPETARRVMQRIGVVLDVARAKKLRFGENPIAEIKALGALSKQKQTQTHHGALPWKDLPEFYAKISESEATASLALRLTILTASRTSEVIHMTWDEVEGDLWTIPAERMKAGREHQVPLCDEALGILAQMRGISEKWVFEGGKRGKPLSNMAMETVLRRGGFKEQGITVHGFRSTFRDWASEVAKAPREVAEAALAHNTMSKTEAAYARSTLLEQRRILMNRWGQFAGGDQAKVVRIG